MAKKKSKNEAETVTTTTVEADIHKEFGEGILVSGNCIIDSPTTIIPFGPKHDLILNGGIPEGSMVLITGPPKVGKTTAALSFAANAQKPQYRCDLNTRPNRRVHIASVEGRLKSRDLTGIQGLQTGENDLTIIKSVLGHILTAEEFLDIVERLINANPGDIFIIDSFSALCTSERFAAKIGDRFRDNTPLLLANFCKRISNVIAVNKCIVIGITHRIANQGQGHTKWSEASGQKIQYQADVKLKATHFTSWDEKDAQIGQDVFWECDTSAIGPPGMKTMSKLRYGYGIDREAEIVDLASDFSLIQRAGGGWHTFPDETKVQGLEKARNYLEEHPEVCNELEDKIRTAIGLPEVI
jgi:recombination protein RecA